MSCQVFCAEVRCSCESVSSQCVENDIGREKELLVNVCIFQCARNALEMTLGKKELLVNDFRIF